MKPYSALAQFYDLLMYDFNYKGIIENAAEEYNFNGKQGMELCCGTGTFSVMLSGKGASLIAIDSCPQMLNLAQQKAANFGAKIIFAKEDINKINYGIKLDFICSICDGLNYLKHENFADFLQKTADALNTGGLLLFDVSTKYKAEHLLQDGVFFEDREEVVYFYTTKYNEKKAIVDREVTLFAHNQGASYIRYDEKGRQYFYESDYIMDMLEKTGFNATALDGDSLKPYRADSLRLLIKAYKN